MCIYMNNLKFGFPKEGRANSLILFLKKEESEAAEDYNIETKFNFKTIFGVQEMVAMFHTSQ